MESCHWLRDLGICFRRLMLLKTIGITAFIWIFFIAYFAIQNATATRAVMMPLTSIDEFIGFHPLAFYPYISLWFYVGITPAIMPNLRQLIIYGLWATALCVAGLACFWFWPTAVPPQPVISSYSGFEVLHRIDAGGNACPSLHVATSIFTAIWLHRLLTEMSVPRWLRVVNWLWCMVIVWSTMATGQHVVLDVLGGSILGLVFARASLWRRTTR
jgi:membrane-associated phospholipid phosphatase